LAITVTCHIFSTSLAIKSGVFAVEAGQERQEKKDKSYTYKSREEIIEKFDFTLKYLVVLYQRVVSY